MIDLPYPLILASASPRRCQLLQTADYEFTVSPPMLDEPAVPSMPVVAAAAWAEAMAYFKARSVALNNPEAIIIGADTIVNHNGTIIGKAKDETDARRILTTVFAGTSEVITGLVVLCPRQEKRVITHEKTTIVMRPMTEQELEDYIAADTWRDKAGAYALQEGHDRFLKSMDGSESNVVGLPMEKLKMVLAMFQKQENGASRPKYK